MPNQESDVPAASASQSKGKSKQNATSRPHQRTHFEEFDPLQCSPGRLQAEGLLPGMSSLSIGEGSSSQAGIDRAAAQDIVWVSARMTSDGMVQFIPEMGVNYGKKMYSDRDKWIETEDGFWFDSKREGCWFFASEIKPKRH